VRLGTRRVRVRSFNAAVAMATAALSCGAPATTAPPTRGATTLLTSGGQAKGLGVGQRCDATGLETCFNATDDNCDGLVDEGCGLATGSIQIVIAWDIADADVDLEVTDPNGEQAEVGKSTRLGLTKDRDCPGEGGDCGGQNFEVVTSAGDTVPMGRYRVTLLLERAPAKGARVHVRIGGHLGQDALAGQVELSGEDPSIFVELLRSASVAAVAVR
jgi:hypothetical protein